MNRKIRQMMDEVERRGGVIHIDPGAPDEIAERFLEQVLDCPDCRAAAAAAEVDRASKGDLSH